MIASSTKFFAAASCGLLLFGVCQATESEDACKALPVTEKAAFVDVPAYVSTDEVEPSDPKMDAFEQEWAEYQNSLVESLKSSPDPRDWAIAGSAFPYSLTSFNQGDTDTNNENKRLELLKRASEAAPDDALVQWMAINGSHNRGGGEPYIGALRKLEEIEPDNAAVWNETLISAGMNKDKSGVSAALRKMSATSRFDNHFSDIAKLIISAYKRNPIPDSLFGSFPDEFSPKSKDAVPLMYATAMTATFGLPALQFVVNACRTDPAGRNSDRASDCSAIGHLMERRSDTVLATRIGFAVLRVSHTYTQDDIEASRNIDWINEQFAKSSINRADNNVEAILDFHRDWIDSGSELEAMSRAVERNDISTVPPVDWVDTDAPLSDERVKQGENYFAEHAIAY